MKQTDERDVIFSRMNYQAGTIAYEDYYARHPERKEKDDFLRSLPQLSSEWTATYDPLNTPIVDASFAFLGDINPFAEGTTNPNRTPIDPAIATERIKGLASYYNAKLVGVARLNESHFYSHRGRKSEVYGQRIECRHPYGIVFAVEMDRQMIDSAPQVTESIAVTKGYVEAAVIGMILSYYIRSLGYEARNHMDGNYLVVANRIARDAGLGEIGRSGLLVTKEFGPRVRLGVVTTDLPLFCDEPREFGLSRFCAQCGRCAKTCPARAISKGDPVTENGTCVWAVQADDCYERWRYLGNDCGICLSNCPFSEGIPPEWIELIESSEEIRQRILSEFERKYPIRPYIKERPDWLK